MEQQKTVIQVLSISFVIALGTKLGDLSAQTLDSEVQNPKANVENTKYPNGISEHQNIRQNHESLVYPSVDTQPDPTVTIGPGVIIGPNVYIRGKPAQNPLLKDVLPANHPLLTNP